MAFVSIIIPFNKGKRYLNDCLESISEQNLDDYEVILVLNGIHEDLDDLLDNYSSRLNLIIQSFDDEIGVGRARNEGLKIARGEYVYFIDSDDYLWEDGLSKLINVAHDTNADFINGERINTYFIKQRFNEELNKKNRVPLKKYDLNDRDFSFKLIVGEKTNNEELLSTLHSLIKKNLIDFEFDENTRYTADYDFIMNLLNKATTFIGVENSIYAKRMRDDPINLTSLNQEEKYNSFEMLYKLYNQVSATKFNSLKLEIVKKLFKFYQNTFISNFLEDSSPQWQHENFDMMSDISKDFSKLNLNSTQQKEIQALQNKNKKSFKRILGFKYKFNKFKQIKSDTVKRDIEIYKKYYNKKSIIDNQIIFISFRGDYYTDSPKYLYQYLYENFSDKFKFVWVVNDENTKIPGNPKKVERFSREYYKEIARSKYWVINGRQAARLIKRDEQVIISTWHGTPLKKLGLDMDDVHTEDPNIKNSYIKVAKAWDYLISPNNFTTNVYKSAFDYDGEILEEGYPRNDILYNADENFIEDIKIRLNIPKNKKVLLYAPTWRDDEFFEIGKVKFQLKLELDKLKNALSDEYVILIRTHYFIADNIDLSGLNDFAFDVSGYDDIAELYLITDILITDYSSVFFDFANLKKPILFYTYDLDKYANDLRGFYLDVNEDLPGPLLFTTQEILDSILNIDSINEKYSRKYDEFYNKFCNLEDGNASKRIVERIWGE